jgi:hypothetical protein
MQTLYLDGLTVFFVPSYFPPYQRGKDQKLAMRTRKNRRKEDCEFEREEEI